ncbi:MAG: molybdopterin molybdotransferase MoeA, partial [Pseudomonadales bacterium]|nr:molybdopterin molybdotransferase MoeA [Pseudomonadales bacterium]
MSLLPVKDALQQILSGCSPVEQVEHLPLHEAADRILAEDIYSDIPVPPVDNSAMDGYALNADNYCDGLVLKVSQRIPAGCVPTKLEEGSCARIFTGASLPAGANAVIMQENTQVNAEGAVVFSGQVTAGQNIRKAGEDIAVGDRLLAKGDILQAASLGLLASVGRAKVRVYRRLSVAVLSTGNELKNPGEQLAPGQIYNSNRFVLMGWLQSLGIRVVDGGCIGDALAPTVKRLQELAEQVDVLISTGGVSVGEEDHVKAAVQQAGRLDIWKIAVKPGKPLAFGQVHQSAFFGLPGNPVSTFVTF